MTKVYISYQSCITSIYIIYLQIMMQSLCQYTGILIFKQTNMSCKRL